MFNTSIYFSPGPWRELLCLTAARSGAQKSKALGGGAVAAPRCAEERQPDPPALHMASPST
eukprot:1142193-Alexandrium_andersonii.AAC.1